jgi:hypothetical protein
MNSTDFDQRRRQPFLDELSYRNTLRWFDNDEVILHEKLQDQHDRPRARSTTLRMLANQLWNTFQLRYTAGEELLDLAQSLTQVVEAFERYVGACNEVPEADYHPPFILDEMIDTYVDYINLLSASVLLHREDLIPRIAAFNDGTSYEKSDAVIEDLLGFYLPDRPTLDGWYWKAYTPLLDAIDEDARPAMQIGMAKYVKGWYKSMKSVAHFWGKHEQIKPEYSPYDGYWAICAAAFTYLYDIDDSAYRNEMVYPKDLVDYARSIPRRPVKFEDGSEILRVLGGQTCPTSGQWFSPAKQNSSRHFKKGDVMPVFDSEYGLTIWQLSKADTAPPP